MVRRNTNTSVYGEYYCFLLHTAIIITIIIISQRRRIMIMTILPVVFGFEKADENNSHRPTTKISSSFASVPVVRTLPTSGPSYCHCARRTNQFVAATFRWCACVALLRPIPSTVDVKQLSK